MKSKLAKEIKLVFEQHANAEKAAQMEAYMKHNFKFYGINAPLRRELQKPFYGIFKSYTKAEQQAIINELWQQPQREFHMCVLDLGLQIVKKMDESWLPFWEEKITSNSWWDSVDCITPSIIGPIIINNEELQNEYAYKWMESDHLWLQRSAIILQLKYKKKTNVELLSSMILARADSKEFFIRKAAGWALREYGKVNPLWVSQFINEYRYILSNLTVKEGERNLIK